MKQCTWAATLLDKEIRVLQTVSVVDGAGAFRHLLAVRAHRRLASFLPLLVRFCYCVNFSCLGYQLTSKHFEVAELRLSHMPQFGSRIKCLCIDINNEGRLDFFVSLIAEEAYVLYPSTIETDLGFVSKKQ